MLIGNNDNDVINAVKQAGQKPSMPSMAEVYSSAVTQSETQKDIDEDEHMSAARDVGRARAEETALGQPGYDPIAFEQQLLQQGIAPRVAKSASSPEFGIDRMYPAELYPTLGTPLQVGTFGGREYGNMPIFGSGGFVLPTSVIHARERQMAAAAKLKKDKEKKIMELARISGPVQYQNQFDQMTNQLVSKWGESTGWNLESIYDDPKTYVKFASEVQDLTTFGAQAIALDGMVTELYKSFEEGSLYIPPSTLDAIYEFKSGMLNMPEMYKNREKLLEQNRKIQGYTDLMGALKDDAVISSISPDVNSIAIESLSDPKNAEKASEVWELIESNAQYDLIATAVSELITPESLMTVAQNVKMGGKFYQSTKDIANLLDSMIGGGIEIDVEAVKKTIHKPSSKPSSKSSSSDDKAPKLGVFETIANGMFDTKVDGLPVRQEAIDAYDNAKVWAANAPDKLSANRYWTQYFKSITGLDADPTKGGAIRVTTNMRPSAGKEDIVLHGGMQGIRLAFTSPVTGKERWLQPEAYKEQVKNQYDLTDQQLTGLSGKESKDINEWLEANNKGKGLAAFEISSIKDAASIAKVGAESWNKQFRAGSTDIGLSYKDENGQLQEVTYDDISTIDPERLVPTATIRFLPITEVRQKGSTGKTEKRVTPESKTVATVVYDLSNMTDLTTLDGFDFGRQSNQQEGMGIGTAQPVEDNTDDEF